jgi:hypothetical protein
MLSGSEAKVSRNSTYCALPLKKPIEVLGSSEWFGVVCRLCLVFMRQSWMGEHRTFRPSRFSASRHPHCATRRSPALVGRCCCLCFAAYARLIALREAMHAPQSIPD